MRSVLVLSLAASFAALFALEGCSGPQRVTSAPAAVSSAPAPRALADPAVPSPPPPPPPSKPPRAPWEPGRIIIGVGVPSNEPTWNGVDATALDRDDRTALDRALRLSTLFETSSRKSDFWSPCVRDFVLLQPEAARDALGEALSLYSTTCTAGPVRRVEFQTSRTDRSAPAQSYLGLVGALEPTSYELALRAAYHGRPVRAERIVLIADGVRWSSPRIDFDDDEHGWEIATLPLTRELARVVRQVAEARDALVRFEASRDYEEVVLTDEVKQDLRVMLDALDAVQRP